MKIWAIGLTATAVITLSGCANVNSIHRNLNLGERSVSLDAKQRGIYSLQRGSNLVICSEPSPDALSASSSSSASSVSGEELRAEVLLALARAEQVASIGLRTQSIQLLRDGLYRACEGFMGGGLSPEEFYKVQRRFQNLTLGLLAIEQLTGAVKAEQVALFSGSGAGIGGNVEFETQALNTARTNQAVAEQALAAERLKLDELNQASVAAQMALLAAQKAVKDPKAPTDAEKSTIESARKIADSSTKDLTAQRAVAANKESLLNVAKQAVKEAEQNLQDARQRLRASATGMGFVGSGSAARSAETQALAKEIRAIVQIVLTESGVSEACLGVFDDFRKNPRNYDRAPGRQIVEACTEEKRLKTAADAGALNLDINKILTPR